MSLAAWVRSIWTGAGRQDPSTYKSAIDGNFAVTERIVASFAPQQSATPNMTVTIRAGAVFNGSTLTEIAQQVTGTITAPAATFTRIDRIVLDQVTGAVTVVTGTPVTSAPVAPAIPAGKMPCAQVLLVASSTTITNTMLTDERSVASISKAYADANYLAAGGPISATTISASGLITATGGQVKFPATQVPSADANTLDDYEEGTWTPSIGGTATYLGQYGRYTKIGRMVFVDCRILIDVIGTGSTTTVSGLPFPMTNTQPSFCSGVCNYFSAIAAACVVIIPTVVLNTSTVLFRTPSASSTSMTVFAGTVFASGTELNFSLYYTTD